MPDPKPMNVYPPPDGCQSPAPAPNPSLAEPSKGSMGASGKTTSFPALPAGSN